jgi:hypothetical protein
MVGGLGVPVVGGGFPGSTLRLVLQHWDMVFTFYRKSNDTKNHLIEVSSIHK